MVGLRGPRQPGPGLSRHLHAVSASQRAPCQTVQGFRTEGASGLSALLSLERSPESKKAPEPARPQRPCFCGGQQPPWLPPPRKAIFMKKGGLDRRQDETTPSMQRPHIFPDLCTAVFQFTGFQIPVISSDKLLDHKEIKREPTSGWRLTIGG